MVSKTTSSYPFESLSNREMEVLIALAYGSSRSEIVQQLSIALSTYDGYRKSIRQKLRIKNQMDWARVMVHIEKVDSKQK